MWWRDLASRPHDDEVMLRGGEGRRALALSITISFERQQEPGKAHASNIKTVLSPGSWGGMRGSIVTGKVNKSVMVAGGCSDLVGIPCSERHVRFRV